MASALGLLASYSSGGFVWAHEIIDHVAGQSNLKGPSYIRYMNSGTLWRFPYFTF